jgi:hypothetical protein
MELYLRFATCSGTSSLHYAAEQRVYQYCQQQLTLCSFVSFLYEEGNGTFPLIPSALLTPLPALSPLCFGNVVKWFCAVASRLKWLQTLKPYVLDCLRNCPWSEIIN